MTPKNVTRKANSPESGGSGRAAVRGVLCCDSVVLYADILAE